MYIEKRKAHYSLKVFQATFARPADVRITKSAMQDALQLGFSRYGIVAVVQSMLPGHFYKSMTANRDHAVWQDVYHVPFAGIVLYVKFMDDTVCGFSLLSFKRK